MLGYVLEGRNRLYGRELYGVPFAVLELPPGDGWRLRHLRKRGFRELRRRGVCHAVVPEALAEAAARRGLMRIEEHALRQEKLMNLLEAWEQPLQRDTVRLRAKQADERVYRAAALLSRRFRRVIPVLDSGSKEMAQWLYCRLGVGQGNGVPELEVSFLEPTGDVPALLLGRECRRQRVEWNVSEEVRQQLFPWEPCGQLLAALYAEGKLDAQAISVKSVAPYA